MAEPVNFRGSTIDLMKDAVHLLRAAPVATLAWHWAGGLPHQLPKPAAFVTHRVRSKFWQSSMKHRNHAVPLSENKHLLRWVDKMAELTKPAAIHWVDGSEEERDRLYAGMITNGTLIKLNQKLWPGCYYARSDAGDVARCHGRGRRAGKGSAANGNRIL